MKKRKNTVENTSLNSDYIKISHYIINDNDEFLCKTRGYDKYILIKEEEYINIKYIVSISNISKKECCLKNKDSNSYDFKDIKTFTIQVVTGKFLTLPDSEFEKFKNIINYE